jgi:hypothetical protein
MKQVYQYKPLEDSLLGQILKLVYGKQSTDVSLLEKALESNLSEGRFFTGTKKSEKQTLLRILPDRFRTYIQKKDISKAIQEFSLLVKGDKSTEPKIDLALEILEWILSGFEEDEMTMELLKELCNQKVSFDKNFVLALRAEYNAEIQKEMES